MLRVADDAWQTQIVAEMETAGSFVYTRLLVAENDFRAKIEETADTRRALQQGIERLKQKRAKTLLQLAAELLPEVIAENTHLRFTEIQQEVERANEKKEAEQARLEGEQQTCIADVQELKHQFEQVSREHTELAEIQQAKQKETTRLLQNNASFVQRSAETIATQQTLANNEARVNELQQQADEKLPAYRNSRLFQFLKSRNYGTSSYSAGFLTGRLDAWVAGIIDYPKAIRSFEFLRTVPVRMREEVKSRKRAFEKTLASLREIENQAATQTGLRLAVQKATAASRRRIEIADQLAAAETRLNEVEQQLESLASPTCEHLSHATESFSQWLAELRTSVLEELADETASVEDDRLVDEIQLCDEQVTQSRNDILNCEDEAKQWREKMVGMQWVLNKFRQNHYDADQSVFEKELDVDTLIQRFADGKSIKESLWAGLEGRQRQKQSWTSGALGKVGSVASHPISQALLFAIANIAGQAAAAAIGKRIFQKK